MFPTKKAHSGLSQVLLLDNSHYTTDVFDLSKRFPRGRNCLNIWDILGFFLALLEKEIFCLVSNGENVISKMVVLRFSVRNEGASNTSSVLR